MKKYFSKGLTCAAFVKVILLILWEVSEQRYWISPCSGGQSLIIDLSYLPLSRKSVYNRLVIVDMYVVFYNLIYWKSNMFHIIARPVILYCKTIQDLIFFNTLLQLSGCTGTWVAHFGSTLSLGEVLHCTRTPHLDNLLQTLCAFKLILWFDFENSKSREGWDKD